jgi:hypothetical protein
VRWAGWLLAVVLALALAWSQSRIPDDGELRRHAEADSVAEASYERARDSALAIARGSDSARAVAERRAATSDSLRRRVVLRPIPPPASAGDRGTAGRIRDTLPAVDTVDVPASVVALVAALDSTVSAQRVALAADSAAILALRRSLAAADTALTVRGYRVVALERALAKRRVPWGPVLGALAVGVVVGVAVGR